MKRAPLCLSLLLTLCPALECRAFLGVADTSFVTVIANPAESANWAAELDRLSAQLSAAQGTLQAAGDLRAYAGDPRAAVAALPDLIEVTAGSSGVAGGLATQADLARAWQTLGPTGQSAGESALLLSSGSQASMSVFGQQQSRDLSLYGALASGSSAVQQLHGQVAREQAVRSLVAAGLADAWARLRSASTESSKQSILAEISQLQSQDQVMASRRRALLDDLELSDRETSAATGARSTAADEQGLAESAVLNAAMAARVQSAETQRLLTLQKPQAPPPAADYSGMKLWTTADTGGTSN
ncbi:MAG TPA: hypothetical protein VFE25_09690 [Opitutaceae bacterium]|nr:hypothetical protein [Opitutaceae bacterium]